MELLVLDILQDFRAHPISRLPKLELAVSASDWETARMYHDAGAEGRPMPERPRNSGARRVAVV